MAAAISTKAFDASAVFLTVSASIPSIVSANLAIPLPNGSKSSAKSAIEFPPVNQSVIPFITSAAVNNNIVSANALTPSIIVGSIFLAFFMNGLRFFIKSDNDVAIPGSPDITPSAKPPIKLPTNAPMPCPIFSSNGIPLSKKSSN